MGTAKIIKERTNLVSLHSEIPGNQNDLARYELIENNRSLKKNIEN